MLRLMKLALLIFIIYLQADLTQSYDQLKNFQIDKKVWVYWNQPIDNAPLLVRLCYQKIAVVCRQQKWTLILLTNQNLPLYIPDYENRIENVIKNAKTSFIAQIGDLIRLNVIEEHGGLYIDISIILTEGLSWLDNLKGFKHSITNMNPDQQPEVLVPYITMLQSSTQQRDKNGIVRNNQAGYTNFFIAAKPHSNFIKDWLQAYAFTYQRTAQQNHQFYQTNDVFIRLIEWDSYFISDKAMMYILQRKQFELDKNLTLFSSRQYAAHHYKLWSFRSEIGPYAFLQFVIPHFKKHMFDMTLEQIEQNYVDIKFFVKFVQSDRNQIKEHIQFQLEFIKKGFNFQSFLKSEPSLQECHKILFPVEGSLIGYIFQNNTVAQQFNLFTITKEERNMWTQYCQNQQNITGMSAIQYLNRFMNYLWIETLLPCLIKSIARIEQNRLYEQNLSTFQMILVYFKHNFIWGFPITLLTGLFFSIWFRMFSWMASFRITQPQSIISLSNKLMISCYYVLNCMIIKHYVLYEWAGDKHSDTQLVLFIICHLLMNQWINKQTRANTKINNNYILGYNIQELQSIFTPIATYCLGKQLLNWTQVRQNKLLADSIIICYLFPVILKQFANKGIKQQNRFLRIVQRIQQKKIILLISCILISFFTNIRFITVETTYLIRFLPKILTFFVGVLSLVQIKSQIFEMRQLWQEKVCLSTKLVIWSIKKSMKILIIIQFWYLSYELKNDWQYSTFILGKLQCIFVLCFTFILLQLGQNNSNLGKDLINIYPLRKNIKLQLAQVVIQYINPLFMINFLIFFRNRDIQRSMEQIRGDLNTFFVEILALVLYIHVSLIAALNLKRQKSIITSSKNRKDQ